MTFANTMRMSNMTKKEEQDLILNWVNEMRAAMKGRRMIPPKEEQKKQQSQEEINDRLLGTHRRSEAATKVIYRTFGIREPIDGKYRILD